MKYFVFWKGEYDAREELVCRKMRDFVWCELGAIWKGRAACQVAVNLLWPRDGAGKQGSGVERVEVPTAGAQALVELQKWILQLEERYIIGQTLSSDSEGSGLGGTGVADLHADTKSKIVAMDAARLASSLTGDDEEPRAWCSYSPGA